MTLWEFTLRDANMGAVVLTTMVIMAVITLVSHLPDRRADAERMSG